MAGPDYYGIEEEMQAILQASPDLQDGSVVIEEEIIFSIENTPNIGIYLESRDPDPDTPLAAGTVQRYHLNMSVWVFVFGMEIAPIMKQRDEFIGKIEQTLMANRNLNGKVDALWLGGGDTPSGRLPNDVGMFVGAEIKVVAAVTFQST